MLTNLPFITITLTTVFPSVFCLITSSFKAAALIPSSSRSEATFILFFILPLICIAISTSSLTKALGSKVGQASLNTDVALPAKFHCSSEK